MPMATIEEAIDEIRRGRMVILMDDKDRENEGDLVIAAEKATPQAINFMATHGRGLICLPLTEEMSTPGQSHNGIGKYSRFGTAFTVSIEAAMGVTTGISAADRARTVLAAIADDAYRCPRYAGPYLPAPRQKRRRFGESGSNRRFGGSGSARGAQARRRICEIMKDDGTMARQPDLMKFARKHKLKVVTIADLIQYRLNYDSLVYRAAEAPLPTRVGWAI